jgi:integral membrane sensor domain MASE1
MWRTLPLLSIVIAITTVPVTFTPDESFWQTGSAMWIRSVFATLELTGL